MKQREELNKVQMDEHSQTYMHKIVNTNLNKTHQFEWTKHQQPVKKKKKRSINVLNIEGYKHKVKQNGPAQQLIYERKKHQLYDI